jgi:two-component system cell cycle sensor histidine kinase/response regulator CckA
MSYRVFCWEGQLLKQFPFPSEKNAGMAHYVQRVDTAGNKILIVEDEGIIAIDLKRKLEQASYTVTGIAADAEEAFAELDRELPDLVLMDIRLRGGDDGIETAGKIRRKLHLPVIFVTSHADDETLQRARVTEPLGYIVKPFAGVNFRAQIEMALWKHRMEQKLRASEAWLAATFNNVADALITTDAEGNVMLMNGPAGRLTGWTNAEAKGRPLFEVLRIFDERSGMPAVHPLETIFDDRELDSGTAIYRLFCREGGSVLIEAEMAANRDANGLLLGIVAGFRDVTERRKAEQQERQLQKTNAIALLATGLARELSESLKRMDEPLTHLISTSKGQTLRMLADIYKHAGRQQTLINELAALGKTEFGESREVDVNQALTELDEKFRRMLGRFRTLRFSLTPGLPTILVEPEGLRDNLLRLVGDAREAMPDGGMVEIATGLTIGANGTRNVQLSICDTGKRMRQGKAAQTFDPYYQSRTGSRNSGMSLAFVYQFVALSGGSVEVEPGSGAEGGTRFLLTFPAAANSPVPPEQELAQGVSTGV